MSEAPIPDTTRLQRIARAYAETAVLFAALDLDLFTHVAGGAATIEEAAAAMGVSRLNAERLIVSCAALGLVHLGPDGALTNAADVERFLVRSRRGYAGAWMQFTRHEVPNWMRLTEFLRSTEPVRVLGMYENLTVEAARRYHEATSSIGFGAGRRFLRHVDLSGRRLLLDLGGGSGGYSIEAVKAHPDLRAIVVDLPPVAVVTAEYIEAHGVGGRVEAVGGDFTRGPLPSGADVVIMASNLPIYDEVVIAGVVARAHAALVPGGEMHLIGEMLDDDRNGPLDAALWGLNETFYGGGGKAHTQAQVIGYFTAAGFVDVAVHEFIPGVLRRVAGRRPS